MHRGESAWKNQLQAIKLQIGCEMRYARVRGILGILVSPYYIQKVSSL